MQEYASNSDYIKNICEGITKLIPGSQVSKLPVAWIVEIPKIKIKIFIEHKIVQGNTRHYFSMILDDPGTRSFKVFVKDQAIIMYDDVPYFIYIYCLGCIHSDYLGNPFIEPPFEIKEWFAHNVLTDPHAIEKLKTVNSWNPKDY